MRSTALALESLVSFFCKHNPENDVKLLPNRLSASLCGRNSPSTMFSDEIGSISALQTIGGLISKVNFYFVGSTIIYPTIPTNGTPTQLTPDTRNQTWPPDSTVVMRSTRTTSLSMQHMSLMSSLTCVDKYIPAQSRNSLLPK